jgi:hypothetical protein
MSMYPPAFKTKRHYALVKKYLGKPPCETCVLKIGCFQMEKSPIDGYWEVYFHKGPCDEAYMWFCYGEYLSGHIEYYLEKNRELLNSGPQKIKEELRRHCEFLNIDPRWRFGE